MKYTHLDKNTILLRLEKGEEVIGSLTELAKIENINFSEFRGIGAVINPVIQFYNLHKIEYSTKEFTGEYEIVNLSGNISSYKGDKVVHSHANFSDKSFKVTGGHLKSALVAATLEVVLNIYPKKINRIFDQDIGLNLLEI